MSITGLGKIKEMYEDVILENGEVKHCKVIYRFGWMYYQDRLAPAFIPVKAGGMPLTDVVYTAHGWTAKECKQRHGRPPQVGR